MTNDDDDELDVQGHGSPTLRGTVRVPSTSKRQSTLRSAAISEAEGGEEVARSMKPGRWK